MKKFLTVITVIAILMYMVLISSCRKQQNGPMPPTGTSTPNQTETAVIVQETQTAVLQATETAIAQLPSATQTYIAQQTLTAAATATALAAAQETETALAQPTATITPTPITLLYDFEGSLDGWILGGDPGFTGDSDVAASSVPSGTVESGNYCAALTCVFAASSSAKGEFEIDNPSPSNFTGTTVTDYIFIPNGMPGTYTIQIYVFDSGYGFHNSTPLSISSLTANAWNPITYSLAGVSLITNVPKFGVQLIGDGATAWSGTIYVDDVTVQ